MFVVQTADGNNWDTVSTHKDLDEAHRQMLFRARDERRSLDTLRVASLDADGKVSDFATDSDNANQQQPTASGNPRVPRKADMTFEKP